jgi:hypothetical protein
MDQVGLALKIAKSKAAVQLSLIEALNEIAFTHYVRLQTSHLQTLLTALEDTYQFARKLNSSPSLKSQLTPPGFNDLLLRLEMYALATSLRVLFRMYAETSVDSEARKEYSHPLLIQ